MNNNSVFCFFFQRIHEMYILPLRIDSFAQEFMLESSLDIYVKFSVMCIFYFYSSTFEISALV